MNAKRKGIRIRLNDEEADMLSELSAKTGRTHSDIFVDLMSKEYKRTYAVDANKSYSVMVKIL